MADATSLALSPSNAPGFPAASSGKPGFGRMSDFMNQPAVRRAAPLLAGLAALALVGATYMVLQQPVQAPVYAGLADNDKAAVGEALTAAGIDFTIDPASGTLTVAADRVHEARIALAGQGLPKAQPSGGSAIAELPMGASRAVEGETLRSAREHDMARTIESIDAVLTAKVHIGAPDPSPFVRTKSATTASVMLTMENGRTLSDGQVQAIRFLVASSVPELQVDQVSVIDQRGALLSETANDGDLKMLQMQARVEDRLRLALDRLLTPMVGPGNFSVEVNADVDLSESQATRETYPQDDRALRSEQVTRSSSSQTSQAAAGVPGATSNLPPEQASLTATPPAATGAQAAPERESNENMARAYEVGREISVTHQPQGRIRRLSVAVALNQGKKALTAAELAKFEALAKGTVGFNEERGDLLAISQRPFVTPEPQETPFWLQAWFMPALQQIGAVLAALLIFFMVGRPMIKAVRERAARREETEALIDAELTSFEAQGRGRGQAAGQREITVEMIEAAPSYDARANLVRNFVRQDPRRAAAVVRRMLKEDANGGA